MNSGKNFYDNHANKETKKKQKSKELNDNNNENSKEVINRDNLLNKKKKREKEEDIDESKEINANDKLEINQNMYNQYNFYQGFVPPIEWQLEQLQNQNINNYQELIQNFYYIKNQYNIFSNDNEIKSFKEKVFTNLKDNINSIYERGIVNNIIGAFFIEECKSMKDLDEININNKCDSKNDKKEDKTLSLKEVKKIEKNKKTIENQTDDNNNENINQENKNEEENNENKLRKPILIW